MTFLAHIADRVINRPLLITPGKTAVILEVLSGRMGVVAPDASQFEGDRFSADEDGTRRFHPYRVTETGVAMITIVGTLVNRGAWIGANSGLVSYEGVKYQIQKAAADPAVRSILLDIQSPGGEAVGAFEAAAVVRQAAAQKKVVAVVNGMAASAAYAIASGASEIVTIETGISGSIGVVLLHVDYSRKLNAEGITPTFIFAGATKVDGNPFEPLSDAVHADLQRETNKFYDTFCATVALGRGKRLTADAARATEARTLIGQEAVDIGLADSVGSFESVLDALSRASAMSARRISPNGGLSMSDQPGAPAADTNTGISQANHDQAVAAAREEGHAAGAQAATTRLAAALGADGIKGDAARMSAALDLATTSPSMKGEQVAAFVTGNVASSSSEPSVDQVQTALENDRQPLGLAMPGGQVKKAKASLSGSEIYSARRAGGR